MCFQAMFNYMYNFLKRNYIGNPTKTLLSQISNAINSKIKLYHNFLLKYSAISSNCNNKQPNECS